VKWISQQSSELSLGVRIPPGAQQLLYGKYLAGGIRTGMLGAFRGLAKAKTFAFVPSGSTNGYMLELKVKIPREVDSIGRVLKSAGFEAYVVGGSLRDLLLGIDPDDWDVATNAIPEEIQQLFPDSFYENKFGTVTVVTKSKAPSLQQIQITPYRTEGAYADHRHPNEVQFTKSLEEDLKRRDFTINALALDIDGEDEISIKKIIDLFQGIDDLKKGIVRAVGNPTERFQEDALRIIRAVRLATKLDFEIDIQTAQAMQGKAYLLGSIAVERIGEELKKMMMTEFPDRGFEILRELGLLQFVVAELEEGWKIGQNKHHVYTVWEHNLRALKYAAEQKWEFDVRMAALLHDVGKPRSKQGDGPDSTFYNHEVIGAKMAREMLMRLKFPKDFVVKVAKLVRYHLFYYNVDEVSESSVRRLIRKVGPEDMDDLIKVRICDRIGSGVPKAEPYKLRHFRFLIEKLARDPISVGMLKVDGGDVMRITNIEPGPKVGFLLNILLEEVLDDPTHNRKVYLEQRLKELLEMSDTDLQKFAEEAKKKKVAVEAGEIGEIKKKHWVK
jgi:tRNA nucleotidyltransferase (CCA-adding enzyme)